MSKERSFRGNDPKGTEWRLVGEVADSADASPWRLWVRANDGTDWLTIKLAAIGAAPNKGNYWWGWLPSSARCNRARDWMTLVENRPLLADAVKKALLA
jgi:hypothetical protein